MRFAPYSFHAHYAAGLVQPLYHLNPNVADGLNNGVYREMPAFLYRYLEEEAVYFKDQIGGWF